MAPSGPYFFAAWHKLFLTCRTFCSTLLITPQMEADRFLVMGRMQMPTGYTADVQSGKIETLRDFALQCARGMGALISMRDDPWDAPIPERLEPHTSYSDGRIAEAQAILSELPTLSPEDCDRRAQAEFETAFEAHTQYMRERAQGEWRYREMLDRVERWQVPEELASFREFMLEQLNSALRFDYGGNYTPAAPERLTGERWREKRLAEASHQLAYSTTERDKELDRTADRNRWLTALRGCLPA